MFPPGGPYPHPEPAPDDPPEEDIPRDDPLEPNDVDPFLNDSHLQYRARKMRRAGLNPRQSRTLALDPLVDTTRVVKVLAAGCAPDLCFHIFS